MNKFGKSNRKIFTAFTLAEVLITLGIIGVVAALVIPPLVQNYQKMTYVTGLKKAYSTFQQGIKLYMADQGTTDLSQTNLFTQDGGTNFESSTTRQTVWDDIMRKYFKVLKICKPGDASCVVNGTSLNYTAQDPKSEFGNSATTNDKYYNFFTSDGTGFQIHPETQWSCTPGVGRGKLKAYCAEVDIDTNGVKLPNKIGRDLFKFILGPDGNLYSFYSMAHAQYLNGAGSGWQYSICYWQSHKPTACGNPEDSVIPDKTTGEGCAARIIENGWQMDY